MFLSHKVRFCMTEQMIFIASKRRIPKSNGSAFFSKQNPWIDLPVFRFQMRTMQQVSLVHSAPETNLTSSLFLNQLEHVLHLLLSPATMQQVSPVWLSIETIHSLLDYASSVVLYLIRINGSYSHTRRFASKSQWQHRWGVVHQLDGCEYVEILDVDCDLLVCLGCSICWRCWARTAPTCVRDGICVDPPLCRGPSQGIYGLRIIVLVCEGETVGKMGEVDEMGERELGPVVSVRCGREWDMTRGWQVF